MKRGLGWALVGALACSTTSAAGTPVRDAAEAESAVGKAVLFTGTAADAKIAAVVTAKDLVVYCLDRPSWPGDAVGHSVTVSGVLEKSTAFQAKVGPNGERAEGTDGPVFVLKTCTLAK